MSDDHLRRNPVTARKARMNLLMLVILIALAVWIIGGGGWGVVWSKFERFWMTS